MFNYNESISAESEIAAPAATVWDQIARPGELPFPIRWALLKFKMKPTFSQYLFQILEGFAHYAETEQQVKRNQFGPHPIFSK